jgi:hypothetical protein
MSFALSACLLKLFIFFAHSVIVLAEIFLVDL